MTRRSAGLGSADGWIEISDASRLPARPVVSVVMLAYNHGPYLAEAIEGVLAQSVDVPVELVIAEDCSRDETRDIALRYQRKHPKVIRVVTSDTNVGMYENFKRSFTASRGEFVALCEGDDYWNNPDKLSLQLARINSAPRAVLVHTDYDHLVRRFGSWRVRRSVRASNNVAVPQGPVYGALQRGSFFVMTCTAMIRAEIVEAFFRSDLDRAQYLVLDWPLFAFAARHGEFAYLPIATAAYRRVPGSAMNSGVAAGVRRARNAMKIYSDFEAMFGPVDRDWSHAEAVGRALYSSAIRARDVQALRDALALLRDAGKGTPGRARWVIDRTLVRSNVASALRRAWLESRLAVREMRDYERVEQR
jgi:glycosyltransferase involved in cell wall biosynthesis